MFVLRLSRIFENVFASASVTRITTIILLIAAIFALNFAASGVTTTGINVYEDASPACGNGDIFRPIWYWTGTTDDSGTGQDYVGYVVYDGYGNLMNGTIIENGNTGLGTQNSSTAPGGWGTYLGTSLTGTLAARPIRLVFYDATANIANTYDRAAGLAIIANGSPIASYTFDPASFDSDCGLLPNVGGTTVSSSEVSDEPVRIFYDGRINDFDTGNPVVLWGVADGDSRALHVYDADGTGLMLVVPAATIDAIEKCPAQNTLIHDDAATNISFWRLAEHGDGTCPFQLNAPTGEPGKWYIIIFDELYNSTYYESHEEFIGL